MNLLEAIEMIMVNNDLIFRADLGDGIFMDLMTKKEYTLTDMDKNIYERKNMSPTIVMISNEDGGIDQGLTVNEFTMEFDFKLKR